MNNKKNEGKEISDGFFPLSFKTMNGNNFNGPGTSLSERLGINERPLDLLSYNNGLFRALDKQAVIKSPEKSKPEPGPDPRLKVPFYVENIGEETNTFGIFIDSWQEEPVQFTFEISEDGNAWEEYTISSDSDTPFMREFTEKLYVRAKTDTYYVYNEEEDSGYSVKVGCMNNFNVGGNTMSLLYGSDFTGNETVFPQGSTYTFSSLFSEVFVVSAKNLILPATILSEGCYDSMFDGCSSLIEAPELPATTLADNCYAYMFRDCTLLDSVTTYVEGEWDTVNTVSWLDGVASEGTLYNLGGATGIPENDSSGCPEGWVIEEAPEPEPPEPPHPETLDWFYVENVSESDNTLTIECTYYDNYRNPITVDYSYDKVNWNSKTINNDDTTLEVSFSSNRKIYLRTNSPQFSNRPFRGENGYETNIYCSDKFNIGGNIMSLLYGRNFTGSEIKFKNNSFANFYRLFCVCDTLISAENLILPATILSEGCYQSMFYGCTSLTEAPQLPATTLSVDCYNAMFYGCSSLTSAPNLPATTLEGRCYKDMFYNCPLINSVTVNIEDLWNDSCTSNWLYGVANEGNLYNLGGANAPRNSSSGCPEGWIFTTYNPNKTYLIGERVYYYGQEYQAIQNVPTNENNQVTDNWDTYWSVAE